MPAQRRDEPPRQFPVLVTWSRWIAFTNPGESHPSLTPEPRSPSLSQHAPQSPVVHPCERQSKNTSFLRICGVLCYAQWCA